MQLKKAGDMAGAFKIYEKMKEDGVPPNLHTYNLLIGGFAKEKDVAKCDLLFAEMKKAGVTPDRWIYNFILGAYAKIEASLEKIEQLYAEMIQAGVQPDIVTLNTMAGAYAKLDPDKVPQALEAIEKHGFKKDEYTYTSLVQGYTTAGRTDKAQEVIAEMKQKGLSTDQIVLNVATNQ